MFLAILVGCEPGYEQMEIGVLRSPELPGTEELVDDLTSDDRETQGLEFVSAENEGWKQDPPFPDRVDPFEFAVGLELDAPSTEENAKIDVQLLGIVGQERPRAMLQVNGKSKVLEVGESWGVIEIVSIAFPEVRMKVDGVVSVWSLLGHRDGTKN